MSDAGSDRRATIEHGGRHDLTEPITEARHEAISEGAKALRIGAASSNRGRGSRRKGRRPGDVGRARSSAALLASAEDLSIEFDPVTNKERTGADRPAELVTRDRDQVGLLDVGGKVDPRQRLDGIGVKPRAGGVTSGDLNERRDVVHHSRLVVDGHDRHDRDRLVGSIENRGETVG